jgi:hypothetical protein
MSIINRRLGGPSYGVDPIALDLREVLRPTVSPSPAAPPHRAEPQSSRQLELDRLYPSLTPRASRPVLTRRLRRIIWSMIHYVSQPLVRIR